MEKEFTIYAGPKEYKTLAEIGGAMNNHLDKIMSFGWAGFIAKFLLLSMNGLHALLGGHLSYGWIIILITVLIKLIFWPLTLTARKPPESPLVRVVPARITTPRSAHDAVRVW